MNKKDLQKLMTFIRSNTKCVIGDDSLSLVHGSSSYVFDITEFGRDRFSMELVYGSLVDSVLLGVIMDYVRRNSLLCFLGVYADGTAYIAFQ